LAWSKRGGLTRECEALAKFGHNIPFKPINKE